MAALEEAGFVVRTVRSWTDDKESKNRVIEQSVPAGSLLDEGGTITITVAKWRNSG